MTILIFLVAIVTEGLLVATLIKVVRDIQESAGEREVSSTLENVAYGLARLVQSQFIVLLIWGVGLLLRQEGNGKGAIIIVTILSLFTLYNLYSGYKLWKRLY